MKSSFLFYAEWAKNIEILTDEQSGVLLKAILALANETELPQMDAVTRMCFSFIETQIERDSAKYEWRVESRSEAGKKGAEARWKNGKNGKNGNAINRNGKNGLYVDVDEDVDEDVLIAPSSSRARMRENEDFDDGVWNPDELITTTDGTQIRLGDVHFGNTVRIGKVSKPSGTVNHPPLTEEEKERILNRLEEFKKKRAGG